MAQTAAVILAGGHGTRMKSARHKVLHSVCGRTMIDHILSQLSKLQLSQTIVITGQKGDQVQAAVPKSVVCVHQAEQLGTAHAVMQAEPMLKEVVGKTLVIVGDAVLLRAETLQGMLALHDEKQAAVTILTAHVSDPHGLGRIIRNENGDVVRIIEEKDATPEERQIHEISSGIFCFDNQALFSALSHIDNNNAQGEYLLPDCVSVLVAKGQAICAYTTGDETEVHCVNDRVQLALAERLMQQRINEAHMLAGVTIIDPTNAYIEAGVTIESDSIIYPAAVLQGNTTIGAGCVIGPQVQLINVTVGDGTKVAHSVLTDCMVGQTAAIGPFSHIRPNSDIGDGARVGNFVEIKNARIGDKTKVGHLSYVGDAQVGSGVNIGCGVVTVNYDGIRKHATVIDDDSFIGSNSNLIAPVRIGRGAYVATGSTITNDVPEGAFAIARERQTTKLDYAEQLKQRLKGQ